MKEIPMLFTAEMVRAILEERKTQTRRLKFNGVVGDRIWVKETFAPCLEKENHAHAKAGFTYRADWSTEDDLNRDFVWKPSIFMPRKASRITLELTALRQERLQDISNSDALAEGVRLTPEVGLRMPWEYYSDLWNSLLKPNDPNRWEHNPTVHVVTFKVL